jgi:hypothetical protein
MKWAFFSSPYTYMHYITWGKRGARARQTVKADYHQMQSRIISGGGGGGGNVGGSCCLSLEILPARCSALPSKTPPQAVFALVYIFFI